MYAQAGAALQATENIDVVMGALLEALEADDQL